MSSELIPCSVGVAWLGEERSPGLDWHKGGGSDVSADLLARTEKGTCQLAVHLRTALLWLQCQNSNLKAVLRSRKVAPQGPWGENQEQCGFMAGSSTT